MSLPSPRSAEGFKVKVFEISRSLVENYMLGETNPTFRRLTSQQDESNVIWQRKVIQYVDIGYLNGDAAVLVDYMQQLMEGLADVKTRLVQGCQHGEPEHFLELSGWDEDVDPRDLVQVRPKK